MSAPDASLIPPGPPPLEAPPHAIPEKRRLRWWMVALGTILVAAVVLGAGLALAAVLRDDGSSNASNRAPAINLPGGLSGVGPAPFDSIPDAIPGATTSSTAGGVTPGASPTSAPPGASPTTIAAGPLVTSAPVTTNKPVGPAGIPRPTTPPRCSINSFLVDPPSVGVNSDGQLANDVAISFNGNQLCPDLMTVKITLKNVPIKTNTQVRRQGSSYIWTLNEGHEVSGWKAGDHVVSVEDNNGQFKGSLPLEVIREQR